MLGTANDTNGGNVGTIEFTVGFPGIIGVINGIEGLFTPNETGCLLGSLTCRLIPRSTSFGFCKGKYGFPDKPPFVPLVNT